MRLYNIIILSLICSLHLPACAQNLDTTGIEAKVLGIGSQNTILAERIDKPEAKINIQLRGLQLMHRNGQCEYERKLAEETTDVILDLVDGQNITLRNPTPTSNTHITEADVLNYQGIDVGQYLLYEAVLAHPTNTGTRADWCGGKR